MKLTAIAGLISAILALVSMLIGHMGDHDLNWLSDHISTFAAHAPYDGWISCSMLMSSFSLLCIGVLISKHQILGSNHMVHLLPLLAGAAISGLVVLMVFEETARSLKALKGMPFDAIRQQSFHDAGLMVFFYCSLTLTVLAGFFRAMTQSGKKKIAGLAMMSLAPAAFFLMTTPWPRLIGLNNHYAGLKQRVSLLSIWLAMTFLLWLAWKQSPERNEKEGRMRY